MSLLMLQEKRGTVAKSIFDTLAMQWPLSAKQVFSVVKRNHRGSITYQAVFKALKGLQQQGVVVCEAKSYSINSAWLAELQTSSAKLHTQLQGFPLGKLEETRTFVFATLFEVDKFLLELFEGAVSSFGGKKPKLFMEWSHFWIPLFFGREEYKRFARFPEVTEAYIVSRHGDLINKWCAEYWRGRGARAVIRREPATGPDFVVLGDMVIQVFYPAEVVASISQIYGKAKSIEAFDADQLFETVFEKPLSVPVVIQRNALLANHLATEVMKNFEEKP